MNKLYLEFPQQLLGFKKQNYEVKVYVGYQMLCAHT